MPYDPDVAECLVPIHARYPDLEPRKMFGGLVYMKNGAMCFGVHKSDLIARVGPEAAEELLRLPYVRPFDITGRAMKGWVMVNPYDLPEGALSLCARAYAFVETLPEKKKGGGREY